MIEQNNVPSLAELKEVSAELCRIRSLLDGILEAWDKLPSEDELREYAGLCDAINFHGVQEAWEALPSEDELRDYAQTSDAIRLPEAD